MTIEEILKEFEKGCSNGEMPSDCPECLNAAVRAIEAATKGKWQPAETAPEDEPHIRGMWVYSAHTGKPLYFAAHTGYVDDEGAFVDMQGDDDYGWSADDYDWWAPLPMPLPEPPK